MKFSFTEAGHRLCDCVKKHPLNVAGAFWTGGSILLGCALGFHAIGLGGTTNESIGGGITTLGEINAMVLGKRWKYSYHFATAAYLAALAIKDAPQIPGDALTTAMLGTVFLGNIPVALEFIAKDKAKTVLEKFRRNGHSFASKVSSFAKERTLWCFANPRRISLSVTALYSAVGLGLAIKNKQYNLIPVFISWLIGTRIAVWSEKHTPLSQTSAKPSGYNL